MATANRGSFGSASNYQRMVEAYGPPRPSGSTAVLQAPAPAAPTGPAAPVGPAVPAVTRTFTADGAFNKAGLLGVLALAVGGLAYASISPSAWCGRCCWSPWARAHGGQYRLDEQKGLLPCCLRDESLCRDQWRRRLSVHQ